MGYFGDEMTRGGFVSHMTKYIEQLMKNPSSAKVDDYLANHGITNEKALEMLLKKPDQNNEESSILIRKERIRTGEDGKDVFSVTYKLPERDKFRQKMRNLYINVFESNIVPGCPINEELNYHEMPLQSTPSPFKSGIKVVSQCPPGSTGDRWANYVNDNDKCYTPKMFTNEDEMVKEIEAMDEDKAYEKRGGLNKKPVNETDCAGALQGGGDNFEAGEYSLSATKKPIRRTVFMSEDQVRYIKKVMSEATAGLNDVTPASELAYPAFNDDKFAGKTLDHKNICADPELMKGAKEK